MTSPSALGLPYTTARWILLLLGLRRSGVRVGYRQTEWSECSLELFEHMSVEEEVALW
jgi:hypothetical protein